MTNVSIMQPQDSSRENAEKRLIDFTFINLFQ